jgi:hypothetical protein
MRIHDRSDCSEPGMQPEKSHEMIDLTLEEPTTAKENELQTSNDNYCDDREPHPFFAIVQEMSKHRRELAFIQKKEDNKFSQLLLTANSPFRQKYTDVLEKK